MMRGALAAAALAVVFAGAPERAAAQSPLPFDIGGGFELFDQSGRLRTEVDPTGRAQLLFFGYANCQEICSAVLPSMAAVVDALDAEGIDVTPVMVTVDRARDTVKTLGPALARHHDRFVGLTGPQYALDAAYDAFSVETKKLFDDPHYGPVYAHGSFLYLLDPGGGVLTLVPPILSPERMTEIIRGYLSPAPT